MSDSSRRRQTVSGEDHVLRVNLGGALRLAAGKYPTMYRAILEGVQNALDALATAITIEINFRKRTVVITDNGTGREIERMREALRSVCHSIKVKGELGKFGLGLMAPLDKCDRYSFTTVPPGQREGYHEWVFNPEEILNEAEELRINPHPLTSMKQVDHPTDAREDWGWVSWRSRLRIEGFRKDRQERLLNLVDLEVGVLDNFNEKMLRLQTMVTVHIISADKSKDIRCFGPRNFSGKLVFDHAVAKKDCSKIQFRIYLSPKTNQGRKGRVVVGIIGDDFRVPFDRFAATTKSLTTDAEGYLDRDTSAGLSSGIFEGEILGSDLDLMPERTGFIDDAALADFCITLNEQYAEKLAKFVEEAREEKEDQRFQKLGLKSLPVIEEFMRQVPDLEELLDRFKKGNVGRGHYVDPKVRTGEQTGPELALVSGTAKSGDKPSGTSDGDPQKERKSHHPFTVAGPEGRIRTLVSKGSTGLTIAYGVEYGSNRVAWLNTTLGRLTINTAHPYFEDVKKTDRMLMQYQEYVAIQTLLLHTYPPDQLEMVKEAMDAILKAYVFQLVNGDKLAGRRA